MGNSVSHDFSVITNYSNIPKELYITVSKLSSYLTVELDVKQSNAN